MPYRFDENTQKVVPDNATSVDMNASHQAKTSQGKISAPPQNASSHGKLSASPQSSNSQSKLTPGQLGKSRGISSGGGGFNVFLPPLVKKCLLWGVATLVILTVFIYAATHVFNSDDKSDGKAGQADGPPLYPRGKKVTPLAINQFLTKTAVNATEDGNYAAAAHLYERTAEEARLSKLNKQYIDALFAQAELYQYNLSLSDKAQPLFEKVLKFQLSDSSTKPARIADTYNDLANAMVNNCDVHKDKIQTYFQKAVSLSKSAGDIAGQANHSYNAAEYYLDQNQLDKALALAKDSINCYSKVKDGDQKDIADSHYLAALCLAHMPGASHYDAADSEYEKALKIYEKAETDEERYAPCMRDAAWNKLRLGDRSEAKELFDKASNHNEDEGENLSADNYMGDALK